jgi:hypothetical protein
MNLLSYLFKKKKKGMPIVGGKIVFVMDHFSILKLARDKT